MKVFKIILTACLAVFLITGCQKEMSLEQQFSAGVLKGDGSGNCLPFSVNGVYKEDSLVDASHFIEVQVNITETGSYIIKSDTVNGYSFSGAGTIDVPGLSTVRLSASGKPIDPGVNSFTITYNTTSRTSTCFIDVTVIAVGPPATYSLGATGSSCTGALVSGIYSVGTPVGAGNTANVNVNVTVVGSYTLSTPVVNGISFTASGDFVATGLQSVILTASGTPTAAGVVNFAVSGASNTCIFAATISAAAPVAIYTLGGAGSNCTGFTSAGTYTAGTALGASNTVSLNVDVTTVGTYTITSTATNGVTFSATGLFSTTGPQQVTLTGQGTPTAAGATTHIVNAGTNTCSFVINYTTAGAQAAYTLTGAPGACTVSNIAGTYTAGTALTASNTVTVQVNVTTVGAYTLTTTAVNGMTFAKSGTFASLGVQTVVLTGTGVPVAAGTHTFTPQVGSSGCTFNIAVTSAGGADFITCKIDGIDKTFNEQAFATFFTPGADLGLAGLASATSQEAIGLEIDRSIVSGGTVTTTTYTMAGASPTTYDLFATYRDAAGAFWDPSNGAVVPKDPFTITISTLTATRVTGTFSGTIRSNGGDGAFTKIISNGSFSLAIQ